MGVWVAGYNMAGYLPEMEPAGFEDFESAKRFLIDEMDRHGDALFDGGEKDLADELTSEMEDLNLVSAVGNTGELLKRDGWGTIVGYESYWITWNADGSVEDYNDD